MAHSLDLRERVLAALERGESKASIARRLEISARSVRRYEQRQQAGRSIEPDTPGPKGPVKLTPADDQILRDAVADRPGVTANEVIPRLSVPVVESTISRAFARLGLSRKKSR